MPVTKSRLGLARPAIRPAMNARVMLSGPPGAGKTWTSLAIAETISPPGPRVENASHGILVIDTEKESALTFADEFLDDDGRAIFRHLPWAAPFDPRELVDTLDDASGKFWTIIIDSGTHFWRGTGGTLDIANGRYTGWKEARPIQVDLVEAILRCDAHVIFCAREKISYSQTKNESTGKHEVEKIGLEIQQDSDLEYEMNVAISIDMSHTMQVSKSRTAAVPVGTTFHPGHAADFAVTYRDWLAAGEPVAGRAQTEGLIDALNRIDTEADRVKAKRAFLDRFGRPEFLLESRMKEAAGWVADTVLAASGGAVAGAATTGADEPGEPETSSERGAAYDEIVERVSAMKPGDIRNALLDLKVNVRDLGDDEAREILIEVTWETTPRPDPVPDVEPDPVNTPDTAPTSPSPETGADPTPETSPPGSDDQGPVSDVSEILIPADVQGGIEAAVKGYSLSKVRTELENRKAPVAGTPQQVRARLVDRMIEEWAEAAAAHHAEAASGDQS